MKTMAHSLRELALSAVEEEERRRLEAEFRELDEQAARIELALRAYFERAVLPFEFEVHVRAGKPIEVAFPDGLRLKAQIGKYEKLELVYSQVCQSCGHDFYGVVILGNLGDSNLQSWPTRNIFLLELGYVIETVDDGLNRHVCRQGAVGQDDPVRRLADALAEVLRAGGYLPHFSCQIEEA